MTTLFLPIAALLASVFILLTGHGLQLTVVPLYGSELGWSNSEIGFTGSAYFLGFVVGCLTVPRLVARAGHIRTFGVLTSTATAALLLIPLIPELPVWLIARLITGWSIAGLYMVIESWLNERTTSTNRGLALSVYTVLTLVSIGIGQLLIGLPMDFIQFFIIAAGMLALGSIPVGLTRSPAPEPLTAVSFELRKVYKASHVAVVGALIGGLTTSSFWAIGPLVAQSQGLESSEVGLFLALTIAGGALFQLPVGRLSDRVDRRLVLVGLAFTGALTSLVAILFAEQSSGLLLALMLIWGGTTFPLYSISLAHANDHTTLPLIQTGSVILLMHSAGAVLGPLVTATLMDQTPNAMFVITVSVLTAFGLWTLWRIRVHTADREHFQPFPDVPRTTQEVFDTHQITEDVSSDADAKKPDQP